MRQPPRAVFEMASREFAPPGGVYRGPPSAALDALAAPRIGPAAAVEAIKGGVAAVAAGSARLPFVAPIVDIITVGKGEDIEPLEVGARLLLSCTSIEPYEDD